MTCPNQCISWTAPGSIGSTCDPGYVRTCPETGCVICCWNVGDMNLPYNQEMGEMRCHGSSVLRSTTFEHNYIGCVLQGTIHAKSSHRHITPWRVRVSSLLTQVYVTLGSRLVSLKPLGQAVTAKQSQTILQSCNYLQLWHKQHMPKPTLKGVPCDAPQVCFNSAKWLPGAKPGLQ